MSSAKPPSSEFLAALQEKLLSTPQPGLFKHEATLADGRLVKHTMSISSGMGYLFWRARYRGRFRLPEPEWVQALHPFQQWQLFSLAIEHERELPFSSPV
jgi:hypothetical protein